MRWLGHFEFGLDYRPFTFGDAEDEQHIKKHDTGDLQCWLEHWTRIYQGVLATAPASAIFWDYDAFCADPGGRITQLAERLELDPDTLKAAVADIQQRPAYVSQDLLPPAVMAEAERTHAALQNRARMMFG